MIVPVDAERDERGYWTHPALFGSGCESAADFHYWLRTQGLQCFVMTMWDEVPELFAVRSGGEEQDARDWMADASAPRRCPTPETGKSKFSPLPAFLQ